MTRTFDPPDLPGVSADLRRALMERSRQLHVPQGTEVFAPGAQADALLMLLSGTLRVEQLGQTGREIVLYRVQAGESCILTVACLLAESSYAASGFAETDLDVMSVPKAAFDDLMARFPEFRGLIFQAYARRITDLMQVIEEVAFRRIDIRLAGRLIDRAGAGTRIDTTQQQLATELGTAREVVSRQLGEFQRRGWVEVGRGTLRLLDRGALGRLAQSDRGAAV